MWDRRIISLAIVVAAFSFFSRPVRAADATSANREVFYLDAGFVGRPVSLDVFGGAVRVSWDAGDLNAPTMLMVERNTDTSTTTVQLTWADPYNLSSRGVHVDVPSDCVADAKTTCTLLRKDGDQWAATTDGRVYGFAMVQVQKDISTYMKSGSASWYKYKNCRCAASPDFPKGTRVKVTSLLTGKSSVVRINDWGPERDKFPDRVIDLDKLAFKEFAPTGAGLIRVSVQPLTKDDPDYGLADLPIAGGAVAVKSAITPKPVPETPTWSY